MKLAMNEIIGMARLIKAGQLLAIDYDPNAGESMDAPAARSAPIRKKPSKFRAMMRAAYPDYGKSLVSQRRRDPHVAGLERGLGTGVTGAVLGALIAAVLSKDSKRVTQGALAGAALGGIPGYISGRAEAQSDYTKLLALRRLGVQSLAEYDQAMLFPQLAKRITTGARI